MTAKMMSAKFDAISVFEEWVVDGKDPQDGDVEITFAPDLTRES